jgi:hypothetical protein
MNHIAIDPTRDFFNSLLGPVGDEDPAPRVPAFGISFPFGDYLRTVEVVANKVWIDRMQGSTSDSPDEEDDYDE